MSPIGRQAQARPQLANLAEVPAMGLATDSMLACAANRCLELPRQRRYLIDN